jgi:hypothetical protein
MVVAALRFIVVLSKMSSDLISEREAGRLFEGVQSKIGTDQRMGDDKVARGMPGDVTYQAIQERGLRFLLSLHHLAVDNSRLLDCISGAPAA